MSCPDPTKTDQHEGPSPMIDVYGYLGDVPPAAAAAAHRADLVIAATPTLDALHIDETRRLPMGRVMPAIAELRTRLAEQDTSVVVLAAGDPGFFGVVRRFRAAGLDVRVHAGPSSVAAAFAAVGLPWDDAQIVSAHGNSLRPALAVCRAVPKVAVLTAPGEGVRELAAGLADLERWFVVAERLGGTGEQVRVLTGDQARDLTEDPASPNVVLVLDSSPEQRGALGRPTAFVGGPRPPSALVADHPERSGPATLPARAPEGPARDAVAMLIGRHLPVLGEEVWVAGEVGREFARSCVRTGAAVVDLDRFLDGTGDRLPGHLRAPDLVVADDPAVLPALVGREPRVVALVVGEDETQSVGDTVDAFMAEGGLPGSVDVDYLLLAAWDGGERGSYVITIVTEQP